MQMNIRIDERIKEQGDAALAQAGYSPSQTIRTVWTFAASHAHEPHKVKNFLQSTASEHDSDSSIRIKTKQKALEQGLHLHEQLEAIIGHHESNELDTLSDRDLRGEALFARWKDKGVL